MANTRNVEALTQAILDRRAFVGGADARNLAEWLASQGVLAPSVLTDEQAMQCLMNTSTYGEGYFSYDREGLKSDLVRIAQGTDTNGSCLPETPQ